MVGREVLQPFVEEEDAALAREQGCGDTSEHLREENQPAANRGTIDQRPIINDLEPRSHTNPMHYHGDNTAKPVDSRVHRLN